MAIPGMKLTKKPASGFQIAFLILAVDFLAAVALKYTADYLGTSKSDLRLLSHNISFAIGWTILLVVAPLRRAFHTELRMPLPVRMVPELVAVALAKLANPLAVTGGAVLWLLATQGQVVACDAVDVCGLGRPHAGRSAAYILNYMLIAIVVGPILEELVYRGFLYRAWERQWGWVRAMLATAIVFGLVHPSHMVSAAIGSIVYVAVLRRTGTIWGPIVVHSAFNLVVSLPAYHSLRAGDPPEALLGLASWVPELACLAFVAVALPFYVFASRRPAAEPSASAPAAHP